jgi:hypothetical protein
MTVNKSQNRISVLLLRGMRAFPCAEACSVSRWQGEG